MNSLFNNPWVTGIICSLVATIIAAVFGYPLSKKRNNNIKRIKRQSANNEVISAAKQYAIEEDISIAVVESLIASTAKKYELTSEELITIPDLCDSLISDILQDPYVSKEMRSQYTSKLIATKDKYNSKYQRAKINEIHGRISGYESQLHSYDIISFTSSFLDRFAPYYIFFYILFYIKKQLNDKGIEVLPHDSIEHDVLIAALSALLAIKSLSVLLRCIHILMRKNRKSRQKKNGNINVVVKQSDAHLNAEHSASEDCEE